MEIGTYERDIIIKNVRPCREELVRNNKVFVYWLEFDSRVKGLIFPNSDIIDPTDRYDVIVTNVREKKQGILLLSEIYHELDIGDKLLVKLSGISGRGDGIFRLHGYFGFLKIKNDEVKAGDSVLANVENIKPSKGKDDIVIATLEQIISLC